MIELSGGRGSLVSMLQDYYEAWNQIVAKNNLQTFEQLVIPTTISWKVAGHKTLFDNLKKLAGQTQQVHIGTVNNRFIATIVLLEPYKDIRLLKILERREGSSDLLGLDSIDYLVENLTTVSDQLAKASGCTLQVEHNDLHSWLSLRFGENREYEAKFTDHLVLQVAQKEMAKSEKEILSSLGLT